MMEGSSSDSSLPVEEFTLPQVPIGDVAQALQEHLKKFWKKVEVGVVDCPDLTKAPYHLASQGIGGYSVIVDLGGVPYLMPLVNRSKVYDLANVIPTAVGKDNFPNGWYITGAGAGPFPVYGTNCELVVNLQLNKDGQVVNKSKVGLTSADGKEMTVKDLGKDTRCALLANLLVSSGSGKVLDIKCQGRLDPNTNITSSIRDALKAKFGSSPVGLGGLFTVDYSKTKIHVMPDFSNVPLLSDDAVNEWLKFFNVDPPFLCQSVLVSTDPGLDLRVEHSHGWTTHSGPTEAGHYHYDTVPEDASYHAIYTVAQKIVRIDRPKETHNIGRD